MALIVYPLPVDTPLFTTKLTLTGTDFILRFDYNGRQDCWYWGIYTAARVAIKVGMKVVCGWDSLRTCVDPNRPSGQIFFFNSNDSGQLGAGQSQSTPRFSDIGRSALLVYIDATVPAQVNT